MSTQTFLLKRLRGVYACRDYFNSHKKPHVGGFSLSLSFSPFIYSVNYISFPWALRGSARYVFFTEPEKKRFPRFFSIYMGKTSSVAACPGLTKILVKRANVFACDRNWLHQMAKLRSVTEIAPKSSFLNGEQKPSYPLWCKHWICRWAILLLLLLLLLLLFF